MQSYMSFNFVFLQLASADYTPLVNEAVNLPIGTALGSQFCTTINILPDGVPEILESFSVLLTSNSPFVTVNPATSSATVNILGDSKQSENLLGQKFM